MDLFWATLPGYPPPTQPTLTPSPPACGRSNSSPSMMASGRPRRGAAPTAETLAASVETPAEDVGGNSAGATDSEDEGVCAQLAKRARSQEDDPDAEEGGMASDGEDADDDDDDDDAYVIEGGSRQAKPAELIAAETRVAKAIGLKGRGELCKATAALPWLRNLHASGAGLQNKVFQALTRATIESVDAADVALGVQVVNQVSGQISLPLTHTRETFAPLLEYRGGTFSACFGELPLLFITRTGYHCLLHC